MHSDQWIKSHRYLSVTSSCYWYLEAMELTFVIGIMWQISYLCMRESRHEHPNLVVGYWSGRIFEVISTYYWICWVTRLSYFSLLWNSFMVCGLEKLFRIFPTREGNYQNHSGIIKSIFYYHWKCSRVTKYFMGFIGNVLVNLYGNKIRSRKLLDCSSGF
jgi:hypothetical protein